MVPEEGQSLSWWVGMETGRESMAVGAESWLATFYSYTGSREV